MSSANLRSLIPRPVKAALRSGWSRVELAWCIHRLKHTPTPSDQLLLRLSKAWSNQGFSGDVSYLQAVASAAASATGPILECGSGLTTLLLAAYAGKRGVKVISLEHMPSWRIAVADALCRFSLPQSVIDAPLRSYGVFDWYEMPPGVPSEISLVICDGPPGDTAGGRYGLLPVCRNLLSPDCTILLDDAERQQEKDILRQWEREFGVTYSLNQSASGAYASVEFP